LLSSVTDPYHGVERKYGLTRGILTALARETYPGLVGILTKSPMVLRDVDILQRLPNVEVGMTITTTDDRLSRLLEFRAPLASRRLQTLAGLHAAGLRVYAFIGPLLPHFRYCPDLLDTLFSKLADAGVESVYVEHINLKQYIKKRLMTALRKEAPAVRRVYEDASTEQHRTALQMLVVELLAKHHLRLRMSEVLYHPEPPRPPQTISKSILDLESRGAS
jgi:DNA repair photolyase